MDVIIYHNPDCGTSRTVLGLLREALREKGTPCAELGLGDPSLRDADLLDAMMAHPILINRPLVVTPRGVALCRPPERVLSLIGGLPVQPVPVP